MIEEPFDSFDDFENQKPIYAKELIEEETIEEVQEAVIEEEPAPAPVEENKTTKRGRKKKVQE